MVTVVFRGIGSAAAAPGRILPNNRGVFPREKEILLHFVYGGEVFVMCE